MRKDIDKERLNYQDTIMKKNNLLDNMRIRVHRYEFSIKEAVLFLSKPMDQYGDWLSGRSREGSQIPTRGTPGANDFSRSRANSVAVYAKSSEKTAPVTPQVQPSMKRPQSAVFDKMDTGARQEVQVMECMRLALNYLTNAQNAIKQMPIDGPVDPADLKVLNIKPAMSDMSVQTDQEEKLRSSSQMLANETPSTFNRKASIASMLSEERSRLGSKTKPASVAVALSRELPIKQLAITEEEAEDGDISSSPATNMDKPSSKDALSCDSCQKYMIKLDHQRDELEYLEKELTVVTEMYEEERAAKERLQESKDILDQELEELTAQLFDQANHMVVEEARLRDQLEDSNKELKGELGDMLLKFQTRERELHALKKSINAIEAAKAKAHTSITSGGDSPYNSNLALSSKPTNISKLPNINIDGVLYQEFLEFVEKIHTSSSLDISNLLMVPFMRRCVIEDIEPCLFYSYQYAGSSIKTVALPTAFKRKLFETLSAAQCEIHSVHSNDDKRTRIRCKMCSFQREYEFKFALGVTPPGTLPQWMECCRFCRDRLNNVLEFFQYIHQLRQGTNKHNSTILGIFRHMTWLRRRISLAKVGNVALFEGDIHLLGAGNEWEKLVSIN